MKRPSTAIRVSAWRRRPSASPAPIPRAATIRRCAELWRPRLLAELPKVELTLLVGGYAQAWALGAAAKANMTETVRAWRDYAPAILPLPHPSWRNTAWLKKNPWFEAEVLPYLRQRTAEILT